MIGRIIIYIHNLAYEFQFLRNIISGFEVFARKPRHPIKAYTKQYDIEFRCSYFLTNMSLEKTANSMKLDVKKQVGDLDYIKSRTPITPLTDIEFNYCEYDIIVLYEVIKKFKSDYEHVFNIPLTQTGKVRRIIKAKYKNNTSYYKKLVKMLPTTYDEFYLLCHAFAGGYTHANALNSNQIFDNVFSEDITSSYPTVMIAEKYPMSKFMNANIQHFEDMKEKYVYLLDVTFYNITSKYCNTYLSKSKAEYVRSATEDNGRIVTANEARYILTNIDIDIISKCYNFTYKINNSYMAFADYLDKTYVEYILELYKNKTELKNVAEFDDLYRRSKEYINALYGMTVTNNIRDSVEFGSDWEVKQLTKSEIEEQLVKQTKRRKTFLNFAWGVWVTAYARRNLWEMIFKVDEDVIYCDTDSVKFINEKNKKYFDEYNKKIVDKLYTALEYHDIDKTLITPFDSTGEPHTLGVFDFEGMYYKFKTMGAKKYAYTDKKGIHITISGVSKDKGVKALTSIEDFKEGKIFGYKDSGRLIMTYNDEQPIITVKDYLGNQYTINQRYGINAMPTTYTLSMTDLYQDYILTRQAKNSTIASIVLERR